MNTEETLQLLEERLSRLMAQLDQTRTENQHLRTQLAEAQKQAEVCESKNRELQLQHSERETHFRGKLGGLLKRLDQLESLTV